MRRRDHLRNGTVRRRLRGMYRCEVCGARQPWWWLLLPLFGVRHRWYRERSGVRS